MISIFKSGLHKVENAGSSLVDGAKDLARDGEQSAGEVMHSAASAANSLYDSGKAGLTAVQSVASKATDKVENLGSKAVQGAENLGSKALNGAANLEHKAVDGAENLGAKALNGAARLEHKAVDGAANLGQKALHGAEDLGKGALHGAEKLGKGALNEGNELAKGALNKVGDVVDNALKPHLSESDKKYDKSTTEQLELAKSGKMDPKDYGNLIKSIQGIHDDQTRIQAISAMYGIQDKQIQDKLGIHDSSAWSGWANQAAGLVGDVHGGSQGWCGVMGKITGADQDLAKGNKKVFTDIAPVTDSFVNNVDKFQTGGKFDQGKFDDWWKTQKLSDASAQDPRFKQGFADYAQAKYGTNNDDKHAFMTAGTVRMAQHEQTELQPEISAAMHGGLFGKAVNGATGLFDKIPGHNLISPVPDLGTAAYNAGAGMVSTHVIPTVSVGGQGTMDISKDATPPVNQNAGGHANILNATGAAREELDSAAAYSGVAPGQTANTGAADYSNLQQRLKVLTAYMMSYSNTPMQTR